CICEYFRIAHTRNSTTYPAAMLFIFFFQAEDGIRYFHLTGVQTCALPILSPSSRRTRRTCLYLVPPPATVPVVVGLEEGAALQRSEERRVGKGCRCRWSSQDLLI